MASATSRTASPLGYEAIDTKEAASYSRGHVLVRTGPRAVASACPRSRNDAGGINAWAAWAAPIS
eukprot:5986916-Lingulodinium_polyedra.AAC.1